MCSSAAAVESTYCRRHRSIDRGVWPVFLRWRTRSTEFVSVATAAIPDGRGRHARQMFQKILRLIAELQPQPPQRTPSVAFEMTSNVSRQLTRGAGSGQHL